MFYVCYFFVYLFFSLLALRAQNQRMDSWGYGVILISRYWIRWLVPGFQGDGEIAPNLTKKRDNCPTFW